MTLLFDLSLPLKNPVLVFSLVLFIFLMVPIVLNKIKVPSILGLIVAGIIIGPYGLNLLERNSSIILFGTVGLLYIMFLAALELDINEFRKSRNKSLIFGALTFIIPSSIGTLVFYFLFQFDLPAAVLIASMFSSHTLVAYPITSKLGISKNVAVTVAVGGTIIADTAVLLVLAVISNSAQGNLTYYFWLKLLISLVVFLFIIFWVFPKIGNWFFRNIEGESTSQFIFVLAMIFTASFLAEVAGVEPIIGAFLAGLSLNRLIPHTSALMNRIEFVGNAIFIPFFLISVGMLVDLRILFSGFETILLAVTLVVLSIFSKSLAAFIAKVLFKFSNLQGKLLYGLSGAHAAATLAVVLVGFELEIVGENVLNSTVLLILVSCLVTSFLVQNVGRQLAILESTEKKELAEVPERILVPISNPVTIENLMDLAIMIKEPKSDIPIYPLAVVTDDEDAKQKVVSSNKMLEKAIKHASASDHSVRVVTRVDLSIPSGILRAIKELLITDVVIGWNAKISTKDKIFGSILDKLLEKSNQMIFVTKISASLNATDRIVVAVPPNAEFELGFLRWMSKIKTLAKQIGANLLIYCSPSSSKRLEDAHHSLKPVTNAEFKIFEEWEDFLILSKGLKENDLFILISAREGSVSYNTHLDKVPKYLSKYFDENNFIVIYPEQNVAEEPGNTLTI